MAVYFSLVVLSVYEVKLRQDQDVRQTGLLRLYINVFFCSRPKSARGTSCSVKQERI